MFEIAFARNRRGVLREIYYKTTFGLKATMTPLHHFRHLIVLFLLLASSATSAQDKDLYKKQWLIQSGDTLPYRILFPLNYDSANAYPVVFFLHGSGERGKDNEKQLTHGWKFFLQDSFRGKHPAIIIFPQCAESSYWSNVQIITEGSNTGKHQHYFVKEGLPSKSMSLLMGLVDNIQDRYKIDKHSMYVGGLSMGGMGTFELVRRKPGVFAAAFPICGGANPATAKQLSKTSWWLFHGLKDNVVRPEFTFEMEAALKKAKAKVKATYYPNANHNSWDPAFAEAGLADWLFAQKR